MRGDREITGRQQGRRKLTCKDVDVDLKVLEATIWRTRALESKEWAFVPSIFVLEASNKGIIGRPKPGRRYENNTKVEVRETDCKFGDCLKLVTDRVPENGAIHDVAA
jgi:hypothetical protein